MPLKSLIRLLDRLNLGIGILFILGVGFLTLMNVILRFFNIAMMGYIELIEVMMVVAALCAMTMAVAGKIQVSIDIIVVTLSKKNQEKLEILWSIICLIFWGAISWATVSWIIEGGYRERTDILNIPILPFQIVWILGLFFISIFYLWDSIISLWRIFKR